LEIKPSKKPTKAGGRLTREAGAKLSLKMETIYSSETSAYL
jgi:hypothetical protein